MTLFGFGLETGVGEVEDLLRHAEQADRAGLDLVSLSDHPYFADRLDAYAALGVILGRTSRVTAAVNVINLPSRPAPMLARMITSLSGGRVALGIGAGGLWREIAKLGVEHRAPAEAVRAMGEAITLIKALPGSGTPVTFEESSTPLTDWYRRPRPRPRSGRALSGPNPWR